MTGYQVHIIAPDGLTVTEVINEIVRQYNAPRGNFRTFISTQEGEMHIGIREVTTEEERRRMERYRDYRRQYPNR